MVTASAVLANPGAQAPAVTPVSASATARVAPTKHQPPNILIVLMDDVGYAADSTFGGPVPTPHLDALAKEGLRYNRFHTTAMCSPTRAALLTGRNHHRVEMGGIVNLTMPEPGYTGVIPDSAATIGDVLGMHGYATAWFGKNHVTPFHEQSAAGPFDRWPTGLGFDFYYGFMEGASDQFNPILVRDRTTIEPEQDEDYIFDKDMADQTIAWVAEQNRAAPDKPWLAYVAPGTGHQPHQAPAEWMEMFRGKFDHGWDEERVRIFARQKALGVVPQDAVLTPRPAELPAWDSLSPEVQAVNARLMEAFAAQRAHFDYQFGRIVQSLKNSGEWDNTLVIFMDGDNGSSAEGGLNGATIGLLNNRNVPIEYTIANADKIGGPFHSGNYSAAWGWALDTPFQWFKQIASHLGATRAGMVVSWPARISDRGGLRTQYSHVNDIAPTIYEAVGITAPATFRGVEQLPIDGTSLVYTFDDPTAASRHNVQYYEMLANVSIYKDGWLASRVPPSIMFAPSAQTDIRWELYNLEDDFSQSRDVSANHPEKLAELQAEWERQQIENGFVLSEVKVNARGAMSRPAAFEGPRTITYAPDSGPYIDHAFPAINNRKWKLKVPVTLSSDDESGTIISQGGFSFGWGLYFIDGKPTFIYVNEPQKPARLQAPAPLGPGRYEIEIEMVPEGNTPGGSARLSMRIDGGEPIAMRLERTVLKNWNANGVGIGREVGMVMLPGMEKPFAFTGTMDDLTFVFEN